jgi:N-dimethylarginine dimethylaminohydrolase
MTAATALTEVDRLAHVAVKHVRDAFIDQQTIAAQWRGLNFTAAPDFARAVDEYERFLDILRAADAAVCLLPRDARTTLDSIYARDASIVCERGVILGRMGKRLRAGEPEAQEHAFRTLASEAVPIAGRIQPPGRLEGGDVVWLDPRTLAVGLGYRTNADGIRQLREILGEAVEVVQVPLPHWRGDGDVMHLMSLISPVDRQVAVVYSALLPVPFREWLLDRDYTFVEVPDAEFETMGTNVLALGPKRCLMLEGNARTRAGLESVGVEVIEYAGTEISVKGGGGPTCLTRPLVRAASPPASLDS